MLWSPFQSDPPPFWVSHRPTMLVNDLFFLPSLIDKSLHPSRHRYVTINANWFALCSRSSTVFASASSDPICSYRGICTLRACEKCNGWKNCVATASERRLRLGHIFASLPCAALMHQLRCQSKHQSIADRGINNIHRFLHSRIRKYWIRLLFSVLVYILEFVSDLILYVRIWKLFIYN